MYSTDRKLNSSKVCGDIALRYGCSVDVAQRIWREGKRIDAANPVDLMDFWKGLKVREEEPSPPLLFRLKKICLKTIPRNKRRSFRYMEYQFIEMTGRAVRGHSKSSLHRKFSSGAFKKHTNAIKPTLTMYNKIVRCEFILSLIVVGSIYLNPVFEPMYDVVHVDEKWFYITEENMTVRLLST